MSPRFHHQVRVLNLGNTEAEWAAAGRRLGRAERSSMWAIGDWHQHGERQFCATYATARQITGLAYQTLRDAAWVARSFEPSRRRDNLTWSHHKEVAGLTEFDADRLLEAAVSENWTRQRLRTEARRRVDARDAPSDAAQAVDDLHMLARSGRTFRTIYADPPWLYDNTAARGAAANHYRGMTVEDIAALPVADLVADQAHLHLWVTTSFLREGIRILEAWGFEYTSEFVWTKPQLGLGNYWRVSHERLLLGVRGDLTFGDRGLRSWGTFDRRSHSEKPDEVRQMIERASPAPRLELFARRQSEGWTVWGDQVPRLEEVLP